MQYRLYGLSEVSGRIVAGGDILVESDEEAVRVGREVYPDSAFEIWCKDRRVFTHELMVKIRGDSAA